MRIRRTSLFALILAGLSSRAGAAPVVTQTDLGEIDWSEGAVRALGVYTPRILSPTASLMERDPLVAAREDATRRLKGLVLSLPLPEQGAVGALPLMAEATQAASLAAECQPPLRLTDGTVHLRCALTLTWLPLALSAATGQAAPTPSEPAGLVLRVKGALRPAVRLKLTGGGATRFAGLPGDPLGRAGVRYFATEAEARAFAGEGAAVAEGIATAEPGGVQVDALSALPALTGRVAVVGE